MNDLFKYLYHKCTRNPQKWFPFLSIFYLTNACKFRCPYCSDGSGKPYYRLPNHTLPADGVLQILTNIRKHCKNVVITGGEPLEYTQFEEVFSNLRPLKFQEIVLTTNGYSVDKYLHVIAQSVSTLVFSLDTLSEEKADRYYGIGKGTFQKIITNINLAEQYNERKYDIFISSVITPENIEDLYEVYEFSQKHKFTFAVAPHLEGVKANPLLINDSRYNKFFDFLISEKRKGSKLFGTRLYLEYMRDLKKFDCFPLTVLTVSPEGNVFYPCLEKCNYAGNILTNNLENILNSGKEQFGPLPLCDNRCHSACALGFALLLKYPFSLINI